MTQKVRIMTKSYDYDIKSRNYYNYEMQRQHYDLKSLNYEIESQNYDKCHNYDIKAETITY